MISGGVGGLGNCCLWTTNHGSPGMNSSFHAGLSQSRSFGMSANHCTDSYLLTSYTVVLRSPTKSLNIQGGSRMRECRLSGSVRGCPVMGIPTAIGGRVEPGHRGACDVLCASVQAVKAHRSAGQDAVLRRG
jgi:hypothetical protein